MKHLSRIYYRKARLERSLGGSHAPGLHGQNSLKESIPGWEVTCLKRPLPIADLCCIQEQLYCTSLEFVGGKTDRVKQITYAQETFQLNLTVQSR